MVGPPSFVLEASFFPTSYKQHSSFDISKGGVFVAAQPKLLKTLHPFSRALGISIALPKGLSHSLSHILDFKVWYRVYTFYCISEMDRTSEVIYAAPPTCSSCQVCLEGNRTMTGPAFHPQPLCHVPACIHLGAFRKMPACESR